MPNAPPDSFDELLARVREEHARLTEQRDRLAQAEAVALDEARAKHVELTTVVTELERTLGHATGRIATLHAGRQVALSVANKARKAVQVLIRGVLVAVALLSLLMMLAPTAHGWAALGVIAANVLLVWFLGDVVDKRELER